MKKDMKEYWEKRYVTDFCDVDIIPSDFVKRTVERIKDKTIKSILDLGCGAGRDSLYLSNFGYDITAFDLSSKALSLFEDRPQNVKFICGDMQNMELPKNSFDMVFANLTLHYFDDAITKKIIKDITNILKKGGVLTFLCKSTKDPLYGEGIKVEENVFDYKYRRHFFDENYINELLTDYNIEIIEEREGIYYVPCAFVEVLAVKK